MNSDYMTWAEVTGRIRALEGEVEKFKKLLRQNHETLALATSEMESLRIVADLLKQERGGEVDMSEVFEPLYGAFIGKPPAGYEGPDTQVLEEMWRENKILRTSLAEIYRLIYGYDPAFRFPAAPGVLEDMHRAIANLKKHAKI